MKRKQTPVGTNRSGSPSTLARTTRTAQGAQQAGTGSSSEAFARARLRIHEAYADELEPIGRVPPPVTPGGMVRGLAQVLQGRDPSVLIDAIGGRLAFERGGVRLYDGLIAKLALQDAWAGGPDEAALRELRDEELQHARLLAGWLEKLGGSPTAMTPMADVEATTASGLEKVVDDVRTTVMQALHAIHVAEAADQDPWAMLVRLAEGYGLQQMADDFRGAMAEEADHLARVRAWVEAGHTVEAGLEPVG